MNYIELFGGLLTSIVALLALYIAYLQHLTNKNQGELKIKLDSDNSKLEINRLRIEESKIRLDLYEKRYRIYTETKKILFIINQDPKISLTLLQEFKVSTNESLFLFDNEIISFLDELSSKAIKFMQLSIEVEDFSLFPVGSQEREDKMEIISELTHWFTFENENVELRFDKYLNFKTL